MVVAEAGMGRLGHDPAQHFFADWLTFAGFEDATHVRFAPTVLNGDVDGTRRKAEAELLDAVGSFAGKLSAAGVLEPANS